VRAWLLVAVLAACDHRPATQPPIPALDPSPPSDPDRDAAEGALAVADRCPDEPQRHDSTLGCADDDPVLHGDRCPDEPENLNEFEDDDGCPDPDPPHVARLTELARELVFPLPRRGISRASRLDARAIKALREVAEILAAHPNIRLEVASHTAANDDVEYSRLDVGRRRAQAIVHFLVDNGVDPARLEPNGYGPDRPVADNNTPEGRARNRRIELVVRPPALAASARQ
jgi:hypothetical protein